MLIVNKDIQEAQQEMLQMGKILYPDSPIRSLQKLQLPKYSYKAKIDNSKGVLHIPSFLSMTESLGQSSLSGCEWQDTESYESPDSLDSPVIFEDQLPFSRSLLDTILIAEWEQRLIEGIFRYDVTNCPNKVIDGQRKYIAQLNEGRANKKRATEFKVDQVVQQFDDSKFNFSKAMQKEVMFMFESSHQHQKASFEQLTYANQSPNLVIINISPIDYGHVLLVPRISDNLPQLVDYEGMCLALQFALEVNNFSFRVGFNSLGAYGTINNLHFQAYYNSSQFAVEAAKTEVVHQFTGSSYKDVTVSRLVDYPVRGFVFEAKSNFQGLARIVSDACNGLAKINQPHNFLICESGRRVFLWPQCYAERQANNEVPEDILECGVNPACFEIAGHLVMKRQSDYDDLSEDYINKLLEYTSVDEERFQELQNIALGIGKNQGL